MSEDLTQYPDAIDDENLHRPPEVGQLGALDQDLFATPTPPSSESTTATDTPNRCWECNGEAPPSVEGLCAECRPFMCDECGAMRQFVECYNCEDGYSGHDCGEDCCCCLHPEDNRVCDICEGKSGWHACPTCQPGAFND